jgi:hypothetical protein
MDISDSSDEASDMSDSQVVSGVKYWKGTEDGCE